MYILKVDYVQYTVHDEHVHVAGSTSTCISQ